MPESTSIYSVHEWWRDELTTEVCSKGTDSKDATNICLHWGRSRIPTISLSVCLGEHTIIVFITVTSFSRTLIASSNKWLQKMGARVSRLIGRTRAGRKHELTPSRMRQPIEKKSDREAVVSEVGNSSDKHNSDAFFERLKDVYVESSTETIKATNPFGPERQNLQDRDHWNLDRRDGHKRGIPPGYVTVEQVVGIFEKRRMNKEYTIEEIMRDFNLTKEDATNLTNFFTNFQIVANLQLEARV